MSVYINRIHRLAILATDEASCIVFEAELDELKTTIL